MPGSLEFPIRWVRPVVSSAGSDLGRALLDSECLVDISAAPAVWGPYLRPTPERVMIRVGSMLSQAGDAEHAQTLVEADIFEGLCSVGAPRVGLVGFVVASTLSEAQIEGAIQALTSARDDGVCLALALVALDEAAATRLWMLRNVFEFVLVAETSLAKFETMARLRQVVLRPLGSPEGLIDVSGAEELL